MQSMAALDAIYSPEWQYRYYSFDSAWGPTEQMGSIRNGAGDDLFVLFNDAGCFLKGFSHEFHRSDLTPEMFYKNIADAFQSAVTEPAFSPQNVSFCAWYDLTEPGWRDSVNEKNLDPDIFFLLQDIDGKAATYQKFVVEYHELESDIQELEAVFQHQPITKELAMSLNPQIDYSTLMPDLEQISYPYVAAAQTKRKGFLGKLFGRE